MVTPALSWASTVEAPRWGATTTEGELEQRRLGASAPWRTRRDRRPGHVPSRMASASASSSTMPPRAVLMMRRPGLALASRSAPDEARRSRVSSGVDGDEVGLGHQLLEARAARTPMGRARSATRRGRRPTSSHAEGEGPLGDQRADPAEADDAERLAVQLDALPLRALPAAGHERRVGLGDVAGLGQQQGHGLLGRREDVRLRGVDHHDATLGGRGHVDVVEADAGPADHDQVGAGRQDLGGHLRGRADDQGVGARRWPRPAARGVSPSPDVDLVAGLGQQVEARLGDLLGDEDPTHGVPFGWRSCG